VNEFVDECRKEWRRLGVPDAIANEMAADLTADIEEAESEGGTAEDVLGNSAFDPRRFAGSWAVARGVTATPMPVPPARRWPALALATMGGAALLLLAGAVVLTGRQGSAAVFAVRRSLGSTRSIRVFGPGPSVMVQRFAHFGGFPILAFLLLAIGVTGLGLALVYWSPWNGSRIGPWEIRRHRDRSGASRV